MTAKRQPNLWPGGSWPPGGKWFPLLVPVAGVLYAGLLAAGVYGMGKLTGARTRFWKGAGR